MFSLAFFDYRVLNSYSTKLYFLMLILLGAVIFIGTAIRGTTGWIGFGGFHIQPVEIAKVIMVIFLASFLSKKKTQLSIVVRIAASIVLVFIPVFLVLKQPDFGSAMIIVASWAMLLTMSGLSKKNLLILVLIGLVCATSSWFFLKNYQKARIINLLNPENDPKGSGYNVLQSIVAVGSGGIGGKGLGHGSQSQLNFLPEKRTDFIFAVLGEELGFAGVASLFVLFGVMLWRVKETARMARDSFGYLIAIGMMAVIFFQTLVNVGMNIGVMPVTGVPLPFVSYGGSSMVTMLAAIGIIQSIYARRVKQ
jgi:rod shape determining protein RodA